MRWLSKKCVCLLPLIASCNAKKKEYIFSNSYIHNMKVLIHNVPKICPDMFWFPPILHLKYITFFLAKKYLQEILQCIYLFDKQNFANLFKLTWLSICLACCMHDIYCSRLQKFKAWQIYGSRPQTNFKILPNWAKTKIVVLFKLFVTSPYRWVSPRWVTVALFCLFYLYTTFLLAFVMLKYWCKLAM